jgi:hypothetical protein
MLSTKKFTAPWQLHSAQAVASPTDRRITHLKSATKTSEKEVKFTRRNPFPPPFKMRLVAFHFASSHFSPTMAWVPILRHNLELIQ